MTYIPLASLGPLVAMPNNKIQVFPGAKDIPKNKDEKCKVYKFYALLGSSIQSCVFQQGAWNGILLEKIHRDISHEEVAKKP